MSTETTPKKSILTDAMERARAIQDAKKSGEDVRTPEEIATTRTVKRVGLIITGVIAAGTAAIVIARKLKTEDETSEETSTED